MADSLHHTDALHTRRPPMREVAKFKTQYLAVMKDVSDMITTLDMDYRKLKADVSEYREHMRMTPPPEGIDQNKPPNTAYAWCVDHIAHQVYRSWYGTMVDMEHCNMQDIHTAIEALAVAPYDPGFKDRLIVDLELTGIVPAERMNLIRIDAEKLEVDFAALQAKARSVAETMREQVSRYFPPQEIK